MTRAKNYGFADESLLKLLDLAHFVSLEFHTAVMMEYALEIRKTNSKMYHSNKAVKVLANSSLRSWGISRASAYVAVNVSGEATWRLVRSRVEFRSRLLRSQISS